MDTSAAPSDTGAGVSLSGCDNVDVDDAGEWFLRLWKMLKSDNLGPRYVLLLKAWLALERTHKFDNPQHGLSSTKRPSMVSAWIKRGRKGMLGTSEKQKVPSVEAFRIEYGAWWELVQPDWRTRDQFGGWTLRGPSDTWNDLDVHGANGVAGVVACLRWWGDQIVDMAEDGKKHEMAVWEKAVIDAAWVMDELRRAAEDSK
ncbi:hypothetical protein BDZ89DRAFT_972887 [Hymenopellis radicata]|nr:hypothetical protein BDZ89DRAFT_972887 [Hymenopellis radicata]